MGDAGITISLSTGEATQRNKDRMQEFHAALEKIQRLI
jgi:hypothetical protein